MADGNSTVATRFKAAVRNKYSDTEEAFLAFDRNGNRAISRTDFKRCLKIVKLDVTNEERTDLRKLIDVKGAKAITKGAWIQY